MSDYDAAYREWAAKLNKMEAENERLNKLINCLVVIIFQDHFDEINAIWERDGGTPRTSVETWVNNME